MVELFSGGDKTRMGIKLQTCLEVGAFFVINYARIGTHHELSPTPTQPVE